MVRFEGLALAIKAGKLANSYPCVLNASKEIATNAFLDKRITFLDITKYVKLSIENHQVVTNPTLDDLIRVDLETRDYVYELIERRD
jgi:1-deoxy-D-xylulose-5-phosphate reductoisomerase